MRCTRLTMVSLCYHMDTILHGIVTSYDITAHCNSIVMHPVVCHSLLITSFLPSETSIHGIDNAIRRSGGWTRLRSHNGRDGGTTIQGIGASVAWERRAAGTVSALLHELSHTESCPKTLHGPESKWVRMNRKSCEFLRELARGGVQARRSEENTEFAYRKSHSIASCPGTRPGRN